MYARTCDYCGELMPAGAKYFGLACGERTVSDQDYGGQRGSYHVTDICVPCSKQEKISTKPLISPEKSKA